MNVRTENKLWPKKQKAHDTDLLCVSSFFFLFSRGRVNVATDGQMTPLFPSLVTIRKRPFVRWSRLSKVFMWLLGHTQLIYFRSV